ncbi:MAG: COX15/CtaA family protein, partial [Thermoanaerobaculia bacterium]
VASVLTYLTVTLGGIVCVTDSSQGCPDWPGCYGQLVPPMRGDSILEFTHRVMAGLTSLFIIASAIAGRRTFRSIRWVSWPPVIAAALLLAVVAFGAIAVLRGLEPGLAALDLGSALMVLALVLTATVVAFSRHGNPGLPDRLSFRSPYAKLTLWTLVTVFIVLVSGVLVAASGSVVRCLGWPLYGGRLIPVDVRSWLQLARRLLAVPASILVIAVVVRAWREQRLQGAIRITATAVGVLFVIETLVGALMLVYGLAVPLQVLYVATAAAFWALLVALVVLASLASPTPAEDRGVAEQARIFP